MCNEFWASLPGEYHGLRILDVDSLNITEYVMDADGTNVVKLTEPGFIPSWSPWLR